MIDFDEIDDWSPKFADVLSKCMPTFANSRLQEAAPQYVEDARDLLFDIAGRHEVIDATLSWIRSEVLCGYHGTRMNDEELASVRSIGLIPLQAESRRSRLLKVLSRHARWAEVSGNLDAAIQAHGGGNRAGRREGQVHLTLSKFGLTDGFNHYLTHGAEFDQHVAHMLLGKEGEELLRQDGSARVVKIAVPGTTALETAHPHFSIEDVRRIGDVPNLVNQFLEAWSYRQAYPDFQCRTLKVDCGMVFRTAVPADWIIDIELLDH